MVVRCLGSGSKALKPYALRRMLVIKSKKAFVCSYIIQLSTSEALACVLQKGIRPEDHLSLVSEGKFFPVSEKTFLVDFTLPKEKSVFVFM